MILTKVAFSNWRAVQAAYNDYMASLGPFTDEELLDYLAVEYPVDPPFEEAALDGFLASDTRELRVALT